MSKILVTGSEGWVGGLLVPKLKELGHEIIAYDKKLDLDIHDKDELIKRLKGVDAVFHLAGLRGPDCDFDEVKKEKYKTILEGSKAVAKAAKSAEVKKLVYLSTGAIYGTKLLEKLPKDTVGREGVNGFIVQKFPFPITDDTKLVEDSHPYSFYKEASDRYFVEESGLVGASLRVNGIDEAGKGPWTTCSHNIAKAVDLTVRKNLRKYYILNIADKGCQVDISTAKKVLGYTGEDHVCNF